MKKNVTAIILYSLAAAIVVAAYVMAVISGQKKAEEAVIKEIKFIVDETTTAYADASVLADCSLPYYKPYLGASSTKADLQSLEERLKYHERMENCECYLQRDSILIIKLEPSEVILDFCESKDGAKHYYISPEGKVFSGNEEDYVIVNRAPLKVYGSAPLDDFGWIKKMISFSKAIFKDEVLSNNIESLNVLADGSLTFNQKDCDTVIIFGNFIGRKVKIERYKRYLSTLRNTELNYKSVDIRYANQLVCKR
ncbi:MAG: hypothetical protein HUJ95_06445 [Bacteroidales bacterium]|mgnify:CR=1 FL=1|nr:hypothetical protein [Bacteroidales bacterium]